MNRFVRILMVGLGVASSSLLASEVLTRNTESDTITISHPGPGKKWKIDQAVCVMKRGEELACGKVTKSTLQDATVQIAFQKEPIQPGDKVRGEGQPQAAEAPTGSSEAPAETKVTEAAADTEGEELDGEELTTSEDPSEEEELEEEEEWQPKDRIEIVQYHRQIIENRTNYFALEDVDGPQGKLARNINVQLGFQTFAETTASTVAPLGHVQFATSSITAVGLQVMPLSFASQGITSNTVGGLITYSYYPTGVFSGVTARMGIGGGYGNYSDGSLSTTSPSTGNTIAYCVLGTAGWRFLMGDVLNIGLEGGVQYVTLSLPSSNPSSLLPVFLMEVGISF